MKKEDVKIGMKVVPHSKSIWNNQTLTDSNCWKEATERNQEYLYVIFWSDSFSAFVLTENEENQEDGEYFNSEDFEPYEEVPSYPFSLPNDRNISDAFYYLKSKGVTPDMYEKLWGLWN